MSDQQTSLQTIERQVKELEAIAQWVSKELNTVAGTERLDKWKVATIAALRQHAGNRIAGAFARTNPGLSFTNDLVEEFHEKVEAYREALTAAATAVRAQGTAGAAG